MGTKYAPWPWFGNREGEEVGNDRLIAAASDLLEALYMALSVLEKVPDDYAMPDHPVWGAARAAIAKATGQEV